MASFLDKKLDFKPAIEALKRVLGILFPFSAFIKSKNDTYHVGTIYNTKHGQPVTIRSEKIMSQYEQMYFKTNGTGGLAGSNFKTNGTGGLAGSNITDSQFSLDMVKTGLKREICDHIMNSDLFEWVIEDTPMGTKVAARIVVNKFENN